MMMKISQIKLWSLAGMLLGALVCAAGSAEDFQAKVRAAMPEAAKFVRRGSAAWEIQNASGKKLGMLHLESIDDGERKMGFGGTIEVALTLNDKDEISGVLIGRNQETPAFLNRVSAAGFLQKWNGMTLKQAAAAEVDAVTGATYSSAAIAFGVKKLAASLLGETPQKAPEAERKELLAEAAQLENKIAMSSYILARSTILMNQRMNRRPEELQLREVFVLQGKEAAEKFAAEHDLAISAHMTMPGRGETPLVKAVAAYRKSGSDADLAAVRREIAGELDAAVAGLLPHNVEHAKAVLAAQKRLDAVYRKLGRNSPLERFFRGRPAAGTPSGKERKQ